MATTNLPDLLVSNPAPFDLKDDDIVWLCQDGGDVAMLGSQIKAGVLAGRPFDIHGQMPGVPDYNTRWVYQFNRAATLPASLTGSHAGCQVHPTSPTVFKIYKGGGQIGSINIASGTATATFTFASAVTFAAGDLLTVEAQVTPDATMEGLHFNFAGSLT
jgi:hypothetical protein